jgi:hypothetical protein
MGLKVDYYERGRILGVRYGVQGPGWGLPLHAHSTRDMYHDVIALRGEVLVFGYGWFKKLAPGDVFNDFDCALPHAVTAQGPAEWLNLFLYDPPAAVLAMREDEKHTELDSRVDVPDWLLKELA